MRAISVLIAVWLILSMANLIDASGSYVPPPPPQGKGVDGAAAAAGKKLLEAKKEFSAKDQSCMSCHGKGAAREFTRNNVKKVAPAMAEQINKCITADDRLDGTALKSSDKRLDAIKAYLLTTYRVQ